MRLSVVSGAAAAALIVSVHTARADERRFGEAGQLVISDDQPFAAIVGTSTLSPTPPGSEAPVSFEYGSVSDNGGSGISFVLAPAVDYFVINGLSVGGNVLVGVLNPAHPSGSSGGTETLFGIVPRVGFNVPISESVSFWPKIYFGYVTASFSGSGSSSSSLNAAAIGLFAPFVFQPARHFILGFGPNVSTQLSSNESGTVVETVNGVSTTSSQSLPKVTQVGLQATIGGWFLGD